MWLLCVNIEIFALLAFYCNEGAFTNADHSTCSKGNELNEGNYWTCRKSTPNLNMKNHEENYAFVIFLNIPNFLFIVCENQVLYKKSFCTCQNGKKILWIKKIMSEKKIFFIVFVFSLCDWCIFYYFFSFYCGLIRESSKTKQKKSHAINQIIKHQSSNIIISFEFFVFFG